MIVNMLRGIDFKLHAFFSKYSPFFLSPKTNSRFLITCHLYFSVILIQLIAQTVCTDYPVVPSLNMEKRLITYLLQNYQVKYGRPVNNMTEKVVVYFEVCLIQLIDLVNFHVHDKTQQRKLK